MSPSPRAGRPRARHAHALSAVDLRDDRAASPTAYTDCHADRHAGLRLNPPPTPEPLWVDPVTSPTSLLSQTLKVYLGRGRQITVLSEAGATTVTGTFSSTTPALVTIPLLPNTTHNLLVQGRVEYISGCFYTLNARTDRYGAPLVIAQESRHEHLPRPRRRLPTSTPTVEPPPSHHPRATRA